MLRSIFNTVAEDYEAARPGYPEALVEDILTFAALPDGARCLEVGCGTGQATLPFARRGLSILCLDIGLDLLRRAQANLSAYPSVRFQNIAFEDWTPEPEPFDLFLSATAFHWVPPEIGYPKAARILHPGATLALIWNLHLPEREGFFVEVDDLYRRYYPAYSEPRKRHPTVEPDPSIIRYIEETGSFGTVDARTYPFPQVYTTAEYLRLINTFSDHLAMPEEKRKALYTGIADLIERSYGGRITKNVLSVLYLAKKKATLDEHSTENGRADSKNLFMA